MPRDVLMQPVGVHDVDAVDLDEALRDLWPEYCPEWRHVHVKVPAQCSGKTTVRPDIDAVLAKGPTRPEVVQTPARAVVLSVDGEHAARGDDNMIDIGSPTGQGHVVQRDRRAVVVQSKLTNQCVDELSNHTFPGGSLRPGARVLGSPTLMAKNGKTNY